MTRVLTIVAAVSGHDWDWIFKRMPLPVVFSAEHAYYIREGFITKPKNWKSALDELVRSV